MSNARATVPLAAGPYTHGELPLPFDVKFDDSDIDFSVSTFTVYATLEDGDGTELTFTGSVDWAETDGENTGLVTVNLGVDDVSLLDDTLRRETRRLQIWAGNDGGNLVATIVIKYGINAAVGTPPSAVTPPSVPGLYATQIALPGGIEAIKLVYILEDWDSTLDENAIIEISEMTVAEDWAEDYYWISDIAVGLYLEDPTSPPDTYVWVVPEDRKVDGAEFHFSYYTVPGVDWDYQEGFASVTLSL